MWEKGEKLRRSAGRCIGDLDHVHENSVPSALPWSTFQVYLSRIFSVHEKKLVPVLKPTLEQFQLIEVGITLNYNFFLAQCTSVFLFNTQKCTDLERKVLHGEIIVQLWNIVTIIDNNIDESELWTYPVELKTLWRGNEI